MQPLWVEAAPGTRRSAHKTPSQCELVGRPLDDVMSITGAYQGHRLFQLSVIIQP